MTGEMIRVPVALQLGLSSSRYASVWANCGLTCPGVITWRRPVLRRASTRERRIASRAKAGPGIYYSTHESRVKLLPAAA